jgi:hypothetical protein
MKIKTIEVVVDLLMIVELKILPTGTSHVRGEFNFGFG